MDKNANCFVLPSRVEGLPNSLVDAMFLCRPVVATRCIPMIERMVEEGVNGYTVPVGDIELMADAMIKAINLKPQKWYIVRLKLKISYRYSYKRIFLFNYFVL